MKAGFFAEKIQMKADFFNDFGKILTLAPNLLLETPMEIEELQLSEKLIAWKFPGLT